MTSISVLKFGSSVLGSTEEIPFAVQEIYQHHRRGEQVVVVVSAMGDETDTLLAAAKDLSTTPAPAVAVAELLATGERRSAALMTIALTRAGVPCTLVQPEQIGLQLGGDRLDGEPVALDTSRLQEMLAVTAVVVLPGFLGVGEGGGTALMGRGGSDLTAVFIAECLQASACRLFKDVDGIYERDPARHRGASARFDTITYTQALQVSGELVQPKAIQRLAACGRTASVAGLLRPYETVIGARRSSFAITQADAKLRVVVLGQNALSRAVSEQLKRIGWLFELVGVAGRQLGTADMDCALFEADIERLLARPHDVLVTTDDDIESTESIVDAALAHGRQVVATDLELAARCSATLAETAAQHGGQFWHVAHDQGAPSVQAVIADLLGLCREHWINVRERCSAQQAQARA